VAQLVMQRPAQPDDQASGIAVPRPREARAGDADGLARLLASAFPEMTWSADRARTELLEAADVTATFVVEEGEALVATASSRHFDQRFPGVGYVHWVAVDPSQRGRGHFETVMHAVLQKFAADARPVAVLETDDDRLPAIAAYLRLGFIPRYTSDDHKLRWSKVFARLGGARHRALGN
jgi:ribosomal protein S18 acetylase RimI-like enzyme